MPIISSARPADALVTRTQSLPRYMGMPTPGTLTQISGFDPDQLASATRMLRDEGYLDLDDHLDREAHPPSAARAARPGISWNCAWPLHGRALDAAAVAALRDLGLLEACISAIRSQLPASPHLPLQLVLPVLPEPLGARLGWPSIDAVLDRLASRLDNAHIVLDAHRGLDHRAVWEIKKRWQRLDLHLDCTAAQSMSVADVERHRIEGGMDGVVVGRAAARDPLVLRDVAVGLGLGGASVADNDDVDAVIHNYAVYADVVQNLYGYPYPIHDLLIPLAHLLRGAQGKAFRAALLQPNHFDQYCHDFGYSSFPSQHPLPSSPDVQADVPDPSECERLPGPTYHFIMSEVDRARGASAAGTVRNKFGLPRSGLRAGASLWW